MEDKSLNIYLDEIGRESLLSTEEEARLSARIQAGDERALNTLVQANLRFVVAIAKQYQGRGLALEDLVSEGNLGLIKAASKFDATRGLRFVSYAVVFIRRQIEKALGVENHEQQAPVHAAQQPTAATQPRIRSVDAPLSHRSGLSLLSVLVDASAPTTDSRVLTANMESAVEFALLSLSQREFRVINAYFGIERDHLTMAEIADEMGLRRERVRQIRNQAIRRLRKSFRHRLSELRDPS